MFSQALKPLVFGASSVLVLEKMIRGLTSGKANYTGLPHYSSPSLRFLFLIPSSKCLPLTPYLILFP